MVQNTIPEFPFRLLDLTHKITRDMPTWPGDPLPECNKVAYSESDGYTLHSWLLSEHAGTHLGAPLHFHEGQDSVDRITVNSLIWPAVVLHLDARSIPGTSITINEMRSLEVELGQLITSGSIVLLHTGWDTRWPDPNLVYEKDRAGDYLWPGFSREAAEWLIEERGARALGTDAPGIDSGPDQIFEAGHFCASSGLPHLENLANLEQMPSIGAFLLAAPLPFVGGSGSSARVFGLLPR